MCLIVHRDGHEEHHLDVEIIALASQYNPDGFGLTWRQKDGNLQTQKFSPGDRDEFRFALGAIDAQPDMEYVAHFRKATHGPATKDLAHPYEYTDPEIGKVLVFHNGIINIKTNPQESDTQVFVRDVLSELPTAWWRNPALWYLVSEAVGWSRLLFMTKDTSFKMGSGWEKQDGLWFSTKPPSRTTYVYSGAGTQYYSRSGQGGFGFGERGEIVHSTPAGGIIHATAGPTDDKDSPKLHLSRRQRRRLERKQAHDHARGSREPLGRPDWWHHGHPIYALHENDVDLTDDDGDRFGVALCGTCGTRGEWYIIEGEPYVDMDHLNEKDDEDLIEDGDALDVESQAQNDAEMGLVVIEKAKDGGFEAAIKKAEEEYESGLTAGPLVN